MTDAPKNLEEPDATFARSWVELDVKIRSHMEGWGLGEAKTWNADLETGLISFVTKDDKVVTGPVQIVGIYDSNNGSWIWGWDHPSVRPDLARDAHLAREFGERYGLKWFITRSVDCTEEDAWEFTAVACHLAGAHGVYRGPAGATHVFMTFGELTFSEDR